MPIRVLAIEGPTVSEKATYSLWIWLRFTAIASFMAGAAVLGFLGVFSQDFALQWQPAPPDLPFRDALAVANGAGLLTAAILMGTARRRWGVALLGALALAWAILFHLPVVAARPHSIPAWLGFAEIFSIAMGAGALFAALSPEAMARLATAARYSFGLCLPVFGLSHLAYPDFTAGMVPSWMPFPLFWAYATGFAHIAAGLSLLSGVFAKLASLLFVLMVFAFVLLLHAPRVAVSPDSRLEWTMLGVALLIGGAASSVAAQFPTRPPKRALVTPQVIDEAQSGADLGAVQ